MQNNNPLIYFIIFLGIFIILPIISPVLDYLGFGQISYWINFIYQLNCHQRPWRSYHLFDFQMSFCAREIGTFTGLFISSVIIWKKEIRPLSNPSLVLLIFVGIVPIAIDGLSQLASEFYIQYNNSFLPIYESFNSLRSFTGLLFGSTVAFIIFPYLQKASLMNTQSSWKKSYLSSILISAIVVTAIVFASYLTSEKYTPSHPLVDLERRIPGYNYEIAQNGGHTSNTNFRFFIDSNFIHCKRAEIYMLSEHNLKCSVKL